MPSLKFFSHFNKVLITLCCALFSINAQAGDLEITPMFGHTFSPKLNSGDNTIELPTTDESKGQGQILVNFVSRDFTDNIDQSTHTFDTLYAHFNGVAFYRQRNYITTFGVGIGATYFKSDFDSVVYPSITIALGTRYKFSDNLAFITELRAYATLTKDDDTVFCQNGTCVASFDGAVWLDSQISIGLAYSF